MASFSALGVGSGMDLGSLLTNLVAAERKPKELLLSTQLTSYNSKISGLGTLSSKLASLQTAAQALKPATLQSAAEKFASYTGSLDEKVGKVTVGEGAVAGSYKLEVTQLAQAQKSVMNAVSGSNLPDSSQNFTIDFGAGDPRNVTISGQTTLEGLRNAINAKQSETGVSATLISDGAGKRLVVSGTDGETFTASGAGLGLDTGRSVAAQGAVFSIDGIPLTSKSNKITDVIDGVTLDLTGTTTGAGTTLSVTRESETKLKSTLEAFVKAYNDANSSIRSLGAYDAETKKAGALQGNSVLRETQGLLSRLVFDTGIGTSTEGQSLSSIGISFSKSGDGSLVIDADKLAAEIAKNPNGVSELAVRVGTKFDDYDKGLGGIVGTGGRIQTSTESLKTSVRDVEKRQEALELHMKQVEARYRAQFSALDVMISSMNSLSNSLTSSLAGLAASSK
ncbi:flagellar hook-associated protein 2 [Betaproteobacteria bacterium]|nr:flagellar hook-associated protein 2 [Betaproteobacteria bacterium]GHU44809.1 flagellar hook-associated protein 2 [Betaproteobacteria bacterium]